MYSGSFVEASTIPLKHIFIQTLFILLYSVLISAYENC